MDYYMNLSEDLGPLHDQEGKNKEKVEEKELEIQTIIMCGCGNHPINPKKDPYKQHNIWAAQFHPKQESGRTDIRSVKGIGSSQNKYKPSYDFSGEEFEVTPAEMRKLNENKKNTKQDWESQARNGEEQKNQSNAILFGIYTSTWVGTGAK